jgi:hypothetical protein
MRFYNDGLSTLHMHLISSVCLVACSERRVFTSQAARELGGALQSEACVRLQEANLTAVGESHVLIVAKAELLEQQAPAATPGDASAAKSAPSPAAVAPAATLPKQEPAGPETAAPMQVEPAVAKTPAAALKTAGVQRPTPGNHPTPPSAGWCASLLDKTGHGLYMLYASLVGAKHLQYSASWAPPCFTTTLACAGHRSSRALQPSVRCSPSAR